MVHKDALEVIGMSCLFTNITTVSSAVQSQLLIEN